MLWYGTIELLISDQSKHVSFLAAFIFLVLYGKAVLKDELTHVLSVSVLLLSVLYWANGLTCAVGYWVAKRAGAGHEYVLQVLDIILAVFNVMLLTAFLSGVSKLFHNRLRYLHNKLMLLLTCPILFIVISEQLVVSAVYGDTVIWDPKAGLVYPVVDTSEILLLQLFACITLISVLVLFCRLEQSIHVEQVNRLLEQQTQEQAVYVQEAQIRESRTRSFRHDIRNHLSLLHELLKRGDIVKAISYLSDLEEISSSISYSFQTGNPVTDVLLGSKLSVARQKGIEVSCEMKIPSEAVVSDTDWCIILGNASDNAIHALENVTEGKRYIDIRGTRKANFFYLRIENGCLPPSSDFKEGIGLSNIRAVVRKYRGTIDIEFVDGVFVVSILLLISHQ